MEAKTLKIIENLFTETPTDIFNLDSLIINDFSCFYDKSIYLGFKQFLTNLKLDDFINLKKCLKILRQFKKFLKGKEFKELKNIILSPLENFFYKLLMVDLDPYITIKKHFFTFFQYLSEKNFVSLAKFYSKLKEKYHFQNAKALFVIYIKSLSYEESKKFQATLLQNLTSLLGIGYITAVEKDEIKAEMYQKTIDVRQTELQIHCLLENEEPKAEDNQKIENMINIIYQTLANVDIKHKLFSNLEMICFGSFINGFSLKKSDIDCTLLTNSYIEERPLLFLLSNAFETLKNKGFHCNLLNFKTIRIPILKIHCEQLADMDLAVNNVLGVANSKLLNVYSKISDEYAKLGKLVKIWGKNHELIGPTGMSSYAVLLLLIYFLQIKKLLPSIQYLAKIKRKKFNLTPSVLKIKRRVKNHEIEEFDTIIEFESNIEEINKYMENNDFRKNDQSTFELLLEFFRFYKENGLFLRLGMQCNIRKGKIDFKRNPDDVSLYSIVDPFDHMHNPGMRVKKLSSSTTGKPERILSTIDYTIEQLKDGDIYRAFNIK